MNYKSTPSPTTGPTSTQKDQSHKMRHKRWTHTHFAELVLLFSMSLSWQATQSETSCPSYKELPYCSCLVVDDQLHVQCSGNDIPTLEKSLQVLNGPVKSFSVYDLDARATILPNGLTDNVTSPVFHFQLSHSSLEDLGETSLRGLSKSLESLAVISARLKFIPQMTLSTVKRLKVLDFEGNNIEELGPWSFNSLLLQKVNLKRNQIENVTENSFWGLDDSLIELDMSENKLKTFPYIALRNLRQLNSLNLAWNEMSDLTVLTSTSSSLSLSSSSGNKSGPGTSGEMEWPQLKYLNLNSNYFRKLEKDTFAPMSNLRTLSIHLNSIEYVDEDAFRSLLLLESIDLSHNKIIHLPSRTFQRTPNVKSIDLSSNHLHGVSDGLFSNLRDLRELLLHGNNILELTMPAFMSSPNIQVIYLQQNSLRFIESGVFNTLRNLSEIRLSENFLRVLPQDIFRYNSRLTSISLDGNQLTKVVPGTFSNCKDLRELRLQNNQITTIPSGVLEKLGLLEEVHLENNRLSLIQGLGSLSSLRYVSLSRNHIERVTSALLPQVDLNSLSLGNNFIHMIEDGAFSNQTTLSVLFLANNKLTHLGGQVFHGLRNLARLHLQKNNISWIHEETFSSGHTKALQYIDLSSNALRTLHKNLFRGLEHIEEINLAHNEIMSIEEGTFTHLQSLRIIDLSYNRLSSLDYTTQFHVIGLEILKICCNTLQQFRVRPIKSIPSRNSLSPGTPQPPHVIGLRELDVRKNQLGAPILKHIELPLLRVLQVCGNNLTELDEATLFGFPSLNFFTAENCHISNLPPDVFRQNPHLAVIRLSENSLTWIPDTVFHNSPKVHGKEQQQSQPPTSINLSLRELHLRTNRLRNIPYRALVNVSNLEVLTLSGNHITSLDTHRLLLPRLKQFDLSRNELAKMVGSGLAECMPSLEVVDFGENNISRFQEHFLNNLSLTQINFGGNLLQKVPFAFSSLSIKSPHVLNMSANPLFNFFTESHTQAPFNVMDLYLSDTNVSFLTGEEFKIYPKLHRLVIKRNQLNMLPSSAFAPLTNLNLLDLSENLLDNLKYEVFAGLVQLKSLNLSRNRIKNLSPFHGNLSALQDLDLSHNQLSRLQPETFGSLTSLIFLRLRGNWLTNLPGDLFSSLVRLTVADLSHNFIENVPTKVLRALETRISTLRLEENPLSCDCDSRDFWEWLQSHPKIFTASTSTSSMTAAPAGEPNFVCERPEELKGRSLMDSDLPAFCTSPAILKLAIQDVRPSSAVVSWQGRNNSGMQGYVVAYHALNHNNIVKTRPLPASSRVYLLPDLQSDTPYLVCVLGVSEDGNATTSALTSRSADVLLKDSQYSKCVQVRTLGSTDSEQASVFQRRLGVLVGALVGLIVFTILIASLACVKLKKRRIERRQRPQNGKLDHQACDPLTAGNGGAGNGNGGTLGRTYHPHNNHHHEHEYYNTAPHGFRNGNGNGTSPPRNLSPEFLNYRHYPLAPTDTHTLPGFHHHQQQSHAAGVCGGGELERL